MRISVEDGVVVCSLDNKPEGFLKWYNAGRYLCGMYNGKLKIAAHGYPFIEICNIERLIDCAIKFGVVVDDAVYERVNALRAALEEQRLREVKEREEREKRELWQRKCEHGCGICKYRRRVMDDHYCAASGDLLNDKNVPKCYNGVHYMFNYEPFPSENCVYKIN